jgi:hypothetical protein
VSIERTDYNEPIALAKQRVAIVERVMKLPYIKATRNAEVGEERFVARDDLIKAIHDYAVMPTGFKQSIPASDRDYAELAAAYRDYSDGENMERFIGKCEKCGKNVTESMPYEMKRVGEGIDAHSLYWHTSCGLNQAIPCQNDDAEAWKK